MSETQDKISQLEREIYNETSNLNSAMDQLRAAHCAVVAQTYDIARLTANIQIMKHEVARLQDGQ